MRRPPPIFILAPPRSFTSVVCGVIGQHPEIYGMPELNLFQTPTMSEYWTGRRADGSLRSPFWRLFRHDGLLRAVAELYAGEQTIETVEMAKRWVVTRAELTAAEAFDELCAKASPLILLDKSPAYAFRREYLDRIAAAAPDARFIHLLRHPRGQCESFLNAEGGAIGAFFLGAVDRTVSPPALDPQFIWRNAQHTILKFLSDLPRSRWMRIRGEDFMRDVEGAAASVCRWLGVSAAPEAIEEMLHPERSPFARIGPGNARLGNDPNFLDAPELRPARVKDLRLEGPLSWRKDGKGFLPEVVRIARYFGYE